MMSEGPVRNWLRDREPLLLPRRPHRKFSGRKTGGWLPESKSIPEHEFIELFRIRYNMKDSDISSIVGGADKWQFTLFVLSDHSVMEWDQANVDPKRFANQTAERIIKPGEKESIPYWPWTRPAPTPKEVFDKIVVYERIGERRPYLFRQVYSLSMWEFLKYGEN